MFFMKSVGKTTEHILCVCGLFVPFLQQHSLVCFCSTHFSFKVAVQKHEHRIMFSLFLILGGCDMLNVGYQKGNYPNHRIIECFGLGKTFKGHLVQRPCHGQGHLQPDQVAQSPVQAGLEHFQGWGINQLSGQPGPGLHHPHGEEFLPYIQSKSALF